MKPRVFLDSSVIIAGLGSFKASSYAVLALSHQGQINTFTSEVVVQECREKCGQVKKSMSDVQNLLFWTNVKIMAAPTGTEIKKLSGITPDPDDVHLFASSSKIPNCLLLSLDKRHVLMLKKQIAHPRIMSPAEFLVQFV